MGLNKNILLPPSHQHLAQHTYWGCMPSDAQLPSDDRMLHAGVAPTMVQLLTADLVEWLATSSVPATSATQRGGDCLGSWLARGEYQREVSYRVVHERRFDNHMTANETWWAQQQASAERVVVHSVDTEAEFQQLYNVFAIGR